MPLYDYECRSCGAVFERQLPVARRQTSCPECLEPACAPLITFRGALAGLTTPGHATATWDTRGMWGAARNSESVALADTRAALEAGAYQHADTRSRQSALTYVRAYELAKKSGMNAEARSIEARMARLGEVRRAELAGAPTVERTKHGLKREVSKPTRRRTARGWDVTTRVKYS